MTVVHTRGLLDALTRDRGDHHRLLGPLPATGADDLLRTVRDSGLTGRGGAAFPAYRKLAGIRWSGNQDSDRPVVVANGAEGEPASAKDRLLLQRAPHLVLDGLALAARIVGADATYLYAPPDLLTDSIGPARTQRSDDVPATLVAAVDSFVSGQESAVVSAVNGGRALPTSARPPVYRRGVGGRPTLVQNVETLAHLALIARFGAAWFRSLGTPDEPGTRLFTVSGAVRMPGVVELPGGSSLGAVVDAAGGPDGRVQALLIGGYHGGWVPWNTRTADLSCSAGALRSFEAAPGAGVVIALGEGRCGLRAGADIAGYLAGQSAAQCGPCRNGLPAAAELLDVLASGRATDATVHELRRIVGLVDGRGACHHPGGTARLVRSTLHCFGGDVRDHLRGRCGSVVR